MEFRYTFPPIDEFVLETGLRVMLVPDHEQDGLVVALQLPVGRFSDPHGLEGCAELTMELMQKGTEGLSSEQFSEKLENAGAILFSEMGEEHCVIGLRMLSRHADTLLPLFWDMVAKPAFRDDEFVRLRREMTTSLQAESVDPGLLANRHFYAELAGREHPAGRFHTTTTVRKLRVDDVRSFYRDCFTPRDGILVVAGSFDSDAMRERWRALGPQWQPEKGRQGVVAGFLPERSGTVVRLIDKPDLTQTTLVIGHGAPGELSPDRNAVALANYIFGAGNFSSRLMTRIRSDGGKTYGISSQISSERVFGAFTISTSTQNVQLAWMIDSVMKELRLFCENGISEAELRNAKRFAVGSMAFQLEGIGNIADKLLWLRFHDRPNSYIENFSEMIERIDLVSANSAISRYFSPNNLVIAAVGRRAEIASVLKQLGEVRSFHFRSRF